MQQIFNQLEQFARQGIAAIFQFVHLIWSWSIGQITSVLQAPWQSWPLWKQVLLLLIIAGIIYVLYKAAQELWEAGEKALGSFTGLLGAFVKTLPRILVAGLIALVGLWVVNTINLSSLPIPSVLQASSH